MRGTNDETRLDDDLLATRLAAQQLAEPSFATAKEVVRWLGAVQAQDWAGTKWAVGLRVAKPVTDADVERAIASGEIVRTHAMRGTWQLVAREDVRWLVTLVAPHVIAKSRRRYEELGLDAATLRRSRRVLEKALATGERTRDELARALSEGGISPEGQRLSHLLVRAEYDLVACGGARRDKQPTWALLDRRVPLPRVGPSREEALAELARRYFESRGPATLADFVWWSGLPAADARAGLEAIARRLERRTIGRTTAWSPIDRRPTNAAPPHLLPAFDEYLVAYRDRSAALAAEHVRRVNDRGGMLDPVVLVDGRVIGTWRRELARSRVVVAIDFFGRTTAETRRAVRAALERYGAFVGLPPTLAR